MSKIERRYLISIFIIICFLIIAYISSFAYFLTQCFSNNENFNNNIFEMIYMGVHAIFLAIAFSFSLKAIKNDSIFMKQLMYIEGKQIISKKAKIISIIFSFVGLAMFIYGLLLILKVGIKDFGFPLGLQIILVNVGLFVLFISLYFYFYPHIRERGKNENK